MTIDELIRAWTEAENNEAHAPIRANVRADIRRILEAVREDVKGAKSFCATRKLNSACQGACCDCPLNYHTATREALEQL